MPTYERQYNVSGKPNSILLAYERAANDIVWEPISFEPLLEIAGGGQPADGGGAEAGAIDFLFDGPFLPCD